MSTDRAFKAAKFDLEICTKIWASKEVARYPLAEAAFQRAHAIRDAHFATPAATKAHGENIDTWRESFRAEVA